MSGNAIPKLVWDHVDDNTIKSQTGCSSCLFEGVDAPIPRVYMWGGTSLCAKHLLALRNPSE